ncbi:MAG TPA: hydrogenase maturation protease [Verrucomicrobiota bacterium]|nr:hydrogenase maturation protease [Verrucomicrobiota bacterium]HNU50485.1 hydrogenase maturation protease [Verrucomicrobiota bacterium]
MSTQPQVPGLSSVSCSEAPSPRSSSRSPRRESGRPGLEPALASVVVVGAGNLLMQDDGVGLHVLAVLREEPIPGATLVEMGTAVLHALSEVEGASRVLLIDAVHGGCPPGTLYVDDAVGAEALPACCSMHSLGLREALRFLSIEPMPRLALIGVEPKTIGYGIGLTDPVRAAVPRVVALVRRTIAGWRGSGDAGGGPGDWAGRLRASAKAC